MATAASASFLLLFAAACSSAPVRVLSVNPPDASVYLNGERIGKGDSRPQVFDFSQHGRICLQATHPDYLPEIEWFTPAKIEQMIATDTDVKITLRPR
jgi:hypothetical protein